MNYVDNNEERYICLEDLDKPDELKSEEEKLPDSVDWTIGVLYKGKFQ